MRRPTRRLLAIVAGSGLILGGIAMLVLPGPGLLSIVGGITLISPKHGNRIIRWVKRQYRRHIASRLHKR
jgi:Putative transmembrane protein (PGPGW).